MRSGLKRSTFVQGEEITEGTPTIGVEPAASAMLGSVVDHVTSLAKRGQVAWTVVGRVVVQMRACGIDPRNAYDRRNVVTGRADAAPSPIAPLPAIGVPPSTVTEVDNVPAMRTPAMLATPLGAAEPDQPR